MYYLVCGIGGATGREVLVITEQDRLGRSVCDLIDLTEALHDGASPQGVTCALSLGLNRKYPISV
jgi:hypothetical protein